LLLVLPRTPRTSRTPRTLLGVMPKEHGRSKAVLGICGKVRHQFLATLTKRS
jgi:hypothetical protein